MLLGEASITSLEAGEYKTASIDLPTDFELTDDVYVYATIDPRSDIIFLDDFEEEDQYSNHSNFLNWDVESGYVDVIGTYNHPYIGCNGSVGCVDIDGSSSQAGVLASKQTYEGGVYSISFDIAGSQRSLFSLEDSLTVAFGDYEETITLRYDENWQTVSRIVNISNASKFRFVGHGSDRVGLLIDNVAIRRISETECSVENNSSLAALINFQVTDPGELSDQQAYLVNVHNVNDPPQITSEPEITVVLVESDFVYQVIAQDSDRGDAIRFSLVDGPAGASIDEESGLITWVPGSDDSGEHTFTVIATDLNGLAESQEITLTVRGNMPPSIVSLPALSVSESSAYTYDLDAEDPNLDILDYSILTTSVTSASIESRKWGIELESRQFLCVVFPSNKSSMCSVTRKHNGILTSHIKMALVRIRKLSQL